ncbi:hypothetical protein [Thalassotalea aquiviva]|uniref:hypothetical protein n=1 Tax=Thalassotalea aquiviva TaxID=3242415 RepID=UPI00352AE864
MTILDQDIPLRENLFYTLQKHTIFWLLLILTAIFDYLSTIHFMTEGSIHTEGNGVVRFLALEVGMYVGVFIGKLLQLGSALLFCALSRNLSKKVILALVLANNIAVYLNTQVF